MLNSENLKLYFRVFFEILTEHVYSGLICKNYFLIFFVWQRMDLGECPKIHDLALRADFENAQKGKDHFYDLDVSNITLYTVPFVAK